MNSRKFSIYCGTSGECILKQEGESGTRTLSDIMEAFMVVRSLAGDQHAWVEVYDWQGQLVFERLL